MRESKKYRAFNFDLDTAKLKACLGETGYTAAYRLIERFFEKRGFEHRQGSGYLSSKKLSHVEVFDTIDVLRTELPFLKGCVKAMDVTDIGTVHDVSKFFKNAQEGVVKKRTGVKEIEQDEVFER